MSRLNEISALLAAEQQKLHRRNRAIAAMGAFVALFVTVSMILPATSATRESLPIDGEIAIVTQAVEDEEIEEAAAEAEADEAVETSDEAVESSKASEKSEAEAADEPKAVDEPKAEAAPAPEPKAKGNPEPAANNSKANSESAAKPAAEANDAPASAPVANEPKTADEQTNNEIAMPAQSFRGEANGITVLAAAPEGAFPEGSTMEVAAVEPDAIQSAVEAVVTATEDKAVQQIDAVKIAFRDKAGEEVEPEMAVKVSLTNDNAPEEGESVVVNVPDEGTASVVEQTMVISGNDKAAFNAEEASTFAMVTLETLKTRYISNNGKVYDITVAYGPEASIPEGAWLDVVEFAEGSDEYVDARNAVIAAKMAKGEYVDEETFGFAALDISIKNARGKEIEPEAEVKVDMTIKSLPEVKDLSEVAESLEIQHHVETEKGVIVDTVFNGALEGEFAVATNEDVIIEKGSQAIDPKTANIEPESTSEDELEVSFGTELFSTYTISWRTSGWGSASYSYGIHYVDTNGNSLTPTMTPTFTNNNMFLIYDIDGYEYDSTHYGSRTGDSIAPLLRINNSERQYYGRNGWGNLRNDVYVVYKAKTTPTTGGTPQVDQDEQWPEGNDAPQFGKSSTNNGNGTNKISLSITGGDKPVVKSTPADVIVVFDVSGSMKEDMNGQTRLARAKTAVNTMANTLLNSGNNDVRMALISFSTAAATVGTGFTNSYNTFRGWVNGLSANGGTNWEQALHLANQMEVRANAATFVVFVTDGDPTFRVSRGNVADGSLDLYTSNTYEYYRSNHVFGAGSSDNYGRNFDFAVKQVSAIAGANKSFYAIGISNDVTKVKNLTTQGGVSADHAFIASDSTAMENAFSSITQSIRSILGFGNVEVTDGITELTNAEMKVMQTVDPNSFRYYRYGGENNKYGNGYANKTEWTSRELDGCAAAGYNEAKGAVEWNMGAGFQLEGGVTYVVEFTVWPSQDAYDLVADLNNGMRTYASLTEAEKAQVVEVTPPSGANVGTYALKTNTDEVNATYNKTTKTGNTVTVSDNTPVTATYHEGSIQNMALTSEFITIQKEWNNELDGRDADSVDLTVTKDSANYISPIHLDESVNWTSGKEYISAGMITKTAGGGYNVREIGHDYTVTEPEALSYYWDLTADIYRPMVIDGVLHVLIKTEEPEGTEGTDWFVIAGGKYQVRDGSTKLTATNDRRSFLNLSKTVAQDEGSQDVPDPDAAFTYTITVTDFAGADVWFSAQDKDGYTMALVSQSSNVVAEMRDGELTGYYYVPSGQQFSIGIKAGWNVRFINLPTGTTYSVQEAGMEDGFDFLSVDADANNGGTPGTVSGSAVTGTIDKPNNDFAVAYTNKWTTQDFAIQKLDENGETLAGAGFMLTKGMQAVEGFDADALKSDGIVEGLKLGYGVYCLTETEAPAGYNILSSKVYFKIQKGEGTNYTAVLCNEDGSTEGIAYENAEVTADGLVIQVTNTPGNALPNTGGPGTTGLTVIGMAMAIAAGAALLLGRRPRKEALLASRR